MWIGAGVGSEHAEQQPHEGGLAGAVEPDQGVDLAGLDVEVDVANAGAAAELAGHAAGMDASWSCRRLQHVEHRVRPRRPA